MSIFLLRYLHSKSIVIQLVILVSNELVIIIVLICVDNMDLNTFDNRGDSIETLVVKTQQLLDTWYKVLKVFSRELKLLKYY